MAAPHGASSAAADLASEADSPATNGGKGALFSQLPITPGLSPAIPWGAAWYPEGGFGYFPEADADPSYGAAADRLRYALRLLS